MHCTNQMLFLPGITFDMYFSRFPCVYFAKSVNISPLQNFLSLHFSSMYARIRSHSKQQDSASVRIASTRVQLAGPGVGHRVGPCDRPFLNTSLV